MPLTCHWPVSSSAAVNAAEDAAQALLAAAAPHRRDEPQQAALVAAGHPHSADAAARQQRRAAGRAPRHHARQAVQHHSHQELHALRILRPRSSGSTDTHTDAHDTRCRQTAESHTRAQARQQSSDGTGQRDTARGGRRESERGDKQRDAERARERSRAGEAESGEREAETQSELASNARLSAARLWLERVYSFTPSACCRLPRQGRACIAARGSVRDALADDEAVGRCDPLVVVADAAGDAEAEARVEGQRGRVARLHLTRASRGRRQTAESVSAAAALGSVSRPLSAQGPTCRKTCPMSAVLCA